MRALASTLAAASVLLMSSGASAARAAAASQVRYTLTARIDSSYDRQWSRANESPPYFGWESWHETTSLSGRSERPFLIARSADGRSFRFTAGMVGGFSHAGAGLQYDWGALADDGGYPDLNSCLTTQRQWSLGGASVRGLVSLSGSGVREIDAQFGWESVRDDPIAWTFDRVCQSGFTYKFRSDGNPRTPPGWYVPGDELRKRFGRAFTITSDYNEASMDNGGRMRNRMVLRFTPVSGDREEERPGPQRWLVDVLGTDRWRWGVLTGLRAGVDVDWLHRSTLEVEDGSIVSAVGKVSIREVRPYSEPPGVFEVSAPKPQTRPEYRLPAASKAKGGRRVTLQTYDRSRRSGSEYLLRYAIRLAGAKALGVIRQAGLPQPDVLYGRLAERQRLEGAIVDSVAPFVPDPARVVFLLQEGRPQLRGAESVDKRIACPKQLSDQACFTNRGGQIVTVTRLR